MGNLFAFNKKRVSYYFERDIPSAVTFFDNKNVNEVLFQLKYVVAIQLYDRIVSSQCYKENKFPSYPICFVLTKIEFIEEKATMFYLDFDFHSMTRMQLSDLFGRYIYYYPVEISYVIYENIPENHISTKFPYTTPTLTITSYEHIDCFTVENIRETIFYYCIFKKSLAYYFF